MSAVRALRERVGDNGMAGLEEVIEDAGKRWKDDVLAIAAERFDRRLAEEMAAMRIDIARESATLRIDMAREFGAFRAEVAKELSRVESTGLKWAFAFWIGQVAAMTALGSFLVRSLH